MSALPCFCLFVENEERDKTETFDKRLETETVNNEKVLRIYAKVIYISLSVSVQWRGANDGVFESHYTFKCRVQGHSLLLTK